MIKHNLDPSAKPYQYRGTMIFMSPVSGVCFDFQYGRCSHGTHHEIQDELMLHICQPCFQIRQILVHHTCARRHQDHVGDRKLGAVAYPYQLSQPHLNQQRPV